MGIALAYHVYIVFMVIFILVGRITNGSNLQLLVCLYSRWLVVAGRYYYELLIQQPTIVSYVQSKQVAIRPVYWQRQSTVYGIIHVYILYLRCEDVQAILCTGLHYCWKMIKEFNNYFITI